MFVSKKQSVKFVICKPRMPVEGEANSFHKQQGLPFSE